MRLRGLASGADLVWAMILASAHLALAATCVLVLGVSIVADPLRGTWDWFWQSVPIDLLRADLGRSLWYLHAQPPLYNLLGGWLAKAFFPAHLQALHALHILLGTLLSGMSYLVLARLLPHRGIALVVATLIALHPSLVLYEAYPLYSLSTAFLVVLTAFSLACHQASRSVGALAAFLVSLTLLILTRSLYQPLLLAPAFLMVAWLAGEGSRRRAVVVAALCVVLVGGWCLKNQLLFGVPSTSSWFGLGLWKIAAADYSAGELRALVARGVLPGMVVERAAFERPSRYRSYGFVATASIPVLARDDFHNVNVPAISRVYEGAAIRLIRQDPLRYLRSVGRSYWLFCRASSGFKHLSVNASRLGFLVRFHPGSLRSGPLPPPDRGAGDGAVRWLLPAALLLHAARVSVLLLRGRRSLAALVRDDPVMTWCFALVLYGTLASCLFEYGEQDRFKFTLEPLLWIFVPVTLWRTAAGLLGLVSRAPAGQGGGDPGSRSLAGHPDGETIAGSRPRTPPVPGWWDLLATRAVWGTALMVGLGLRWLGAVDTEVRAALPPDAIRPEQGLAYIAPVPVRATFPYRLRGALVGVSPAGRLWLYEDALPLGPPDTRHDTIRREGQGAYSYWGQMLYFSSSDGSDPAGNGRRYTVAGLPALDPWIEDLATGLLALAGVGWLAALRGAQAGNPAPRTVVRGAQVVAGVGALGGLGLMALTVWPPVRSGVIAPEAMTPGPGWGYFADAPGPPLAGWPPILTDRWEGMPEVVLRESGRLLGPRVAPTRVAAQGTGRYGFGDRRLVFSTSDGSDPRTNGRTYAWSVTGRVRGVAWLTTVSCLLAGVSIGMTRRAPRVARPGRRRTRPGG